MKRFILIGITILLYSAGAQAGIFVGATSRDFQGKDLNGDVINLHHYENKIVVLEWTSPACPYSQLRYKTNAMQKVQKFVQDNGGVWLTIISDGPQEQGYVTPEQARLFLKKENAHPTKMILDTTSHLARMFNAQSTPHIIILNKKHTIVYSGAFDSRTALRETTKPIKNYVLETWEDLKAEREVRVPITRSYGCMIHYAKPLN